MERYGAAMKELGSPTPRSICELADHEAGILAQIAPASGGELSGLQARHGDEWLELLYRANDFSETEDWRGRAPLLWPAVGRNFTEEQIREAERTGDEPEPGSYRIGDAEYQMPCHGFVMTEAWKLESSLTDDSHAEATCSLESGDYGRCYYPFEYRLELRYVLRDGVLTVEFTISADGGNAQPMPFSIGNHISLNFPFTTRGRQGATPASGGASAPSQWNDGLLVGSPRAGLGITDLSLFDGTEWPKDFSQGLPLSDESVCNAVTARLEEPLSLELVEPGEMSVRVTQRVPAGLGLDDQLFFVLWGDPEAGYFCPEPWLGGPNSLNTGEGLVRLDPGKAFTWTMVVEAISQS